MKVHPARAPLGAISANKARAEYLAPELVECATAQCDAATQPSKRLERVVRLPCSKCDAILPEFTASWDLNTCGVAVRVVTCGKCERVRPHIPLGGTAYIYACISLSLSHTQVAAGRRSRFGR